MLVLSRRQDDKVLFPNLGITVQILRVEGAKVRIGIKAPPEVKILRHELQEHRADTLPFRPGQPNPTAADDRELRRRLHAAADSLNSLSQLCDRDLRPESERLILNIFQHLRSIDEAAAVDEPAPVASPLGNRRALLVDDNVNECRLLAGYLRTQSFEVDVANDGGAAIDYLDRHAAPDVVLLDMQMPGVDGPSAIRRMRADERHHGLRVYAVSGSDPADYGVDIGPRGVDGWFPKPLDPEALVFRLAFEEGGEPLHEEPMEHGSSARGDSMVFS